MLRRWPRLASINLNLIPNHRQESRRYWNLVVVACNRRCVTTIFHNLLPSTVTILAKSPQTGWKIYSTMATSNLMWKRCRRGSSSHLAFSSALKAMKISNLYRIYRTPKIIQTLSIPSSKYYTKRIEKVPVPIRQIKFILPSILNMTNNNHLPNLRKKRRVRKSSIMRSCNKI